LKKNINFADRALLQLIKKLNQRELSNFIDYLYSTEFRLNKDVKDFFSYITQNHPVYTYQLDFLLAKFFVTKSRDKALQKLNSVCTLIKKILERWLVYQEAVNNPITYNQLKAQAYAKYVSADNYSNILDKIPEVLTETSVGDLTAYHAKFIVASLKFHHPDTERIGIKQTPENLSVYLDDYYVANKLKLYCQHLSSKNIVNKSSGFTLSHEVKAYARQKISNLYYKLYLDLIQLYETHKQALIPQLKVNYEQYHEIFSRNEKAIFLRLFINYVIRLSNGGQKAYVPLQFELFQLLIQQKLLIFNERITFASFNNILRTACFLKEFRFVKKFKRDYEQYLNPEIKEDTIHFSNGFIAFHQQQYEKASLVLNSITFHGLGFKLISRALITRCYYENFQKDRHFKTTLLDYVINFKKFITRNKVLSEQKKAPYLLFLTGVRKLCKGKFIANSLKMKRKQALTACFKDKDFVTIAKPWLLAKIEEL